VAQTKRRAAQLGVPARFLPDLNRDEIGRRFEDDDHAYVNKCFYPWYAIRINPYGVVYPCAMNIDMGNLRTESLARIWNSPKYIQFRQKLSDVRLFPKCAKCCALTNKVWDYLPAKRRRLRGQRPATHNGQESPSSPLP
jgi:radical SAM protein with 4Fe4S-binding SPASM domain